MSEDLRRRYTKLALKEAIIKILKEKPLNKITVKELCEKAEINRATFYNNYEDIYDFYETLEKEFFEGYYKPCDLVKGCFTRKALEKMYNEQVDFLLKNKEIFNIVYRNGRCFFQLEKMNEMVREAALSSSKFENWTDDEEIVFRTEKELNLMLTYMSNGNFAMFYKILNSETDYSKEEIVDILLRLLYKKAFTDNDGV